LHPDGFCKLVARRMVICAALSDDMVQVAEGTPHVLQPLAERAVGVSVHLVHQLTREVHECRAKLPRPRLG
jgi:hypothetical protein